MWDTCLDLLTLFAQGPLSLVNTVYTRLPVVTRVLLVTDPKHGFPSHVLDVCTRCEFQCCETVDEFLWVYMICPMLLTNGP